MADYTCLCSLLLVNGLPTLACFSLVLLDGRPMMACVPWFKCGRLHKPSENIEGVHIIKIRARLLVI